MVVLHSGKQKVIRMTRYILLSLGLLILAPAAMAADAPAAEAPPADCALDAGAVKPILTPEGGIAGSHQVYPNEKERSLSETLTLQNGLHIKYTVGGCAHYVFSYEFTEIPENVSKEYEPIDLAIVLMNSVPGFQEGPHNFLTEMMKESKRKGDLPDDDGNFGCGEARCSLVSNAEEKTLTLSYDFAL
jgi:hypothetical protein